MVTPSKTWNRLAAAAAPTAAAVVRPRSSMRIKRTSGGTMTPTHLSDTFRSVSESIASEAAVTKVAKRRRAKVLSPMFKVFFSQVLFSEIFSYLHPDTNPNNRRAHSLYQEIVTTFQEQMIQHRRKTESALGFLLRDNYEFYYSIVKAWLDRAPKKFNRRKGNWASFMLITSARHPLSSLHTISVVCSEWNRMCVAIRRQFESRISEIRWNILVRVPPVDNGTITQILGALIDQRDLRRLLIFLEKCKKFHADKLEQIFHYSNYYNGLMLAICDNPKLGFSKKTTWEAYDEAVAIADRVYEFIKENRLYLFPQVIPSTGVLLINAAPLGFSWLVYKVSNETDPELKQCFLKRFRDPFYVFYEQEAHRIGRILKKSANMLVALIKLKRTVTLKRLCDSFPDLAKQLARNVPLKDCINEPHSQLDKMFAYLEGKKLLELSAPSPEFELHLAKGDLPLTQAAKTAKLDRPGLAS